MDLVRHPHLITSKLFTDPPFSLTGNVNGIRNEIWSGIRRLIRDVKTLEDGIPAIIG